MYYQRISIKEGLNVESEKPHLERYDKTKSRKCRLCSQIFIIKKKVKDNDNDCNQCFKITNDITKTGRMYVIWKENVKYRVYTNLCCWKFKLFFWRQKQLNQLLIFLGKSKRALELHCIWIAGLTIQM